MARRIEIFCPKCQWNPRPNDLWGCNCGCAWNTFETNGTCPECGKAWPDTQCLSCDSWSPHPNWYHEFNDDEVTKEEEVVLETASDS